jgi:phosphatidylglycerol:prolipoprotein diacylglycerol transferase
VIDIFSDQVMNWPRGRNELHLIVERNGQEVDIPAFVPRTLGLHPTQLYETISMSLLLFLLLAYYPFRRHNGQVFVLLMVGYAIHRFLNEILRNDTPVEWYQMTLSQNISVLILAAAVVLELWLRWTQPKRSECGIEEILPEPEPVAEAQHAR